jgi:hypothetical protein
MENQQVSQVWVTMSDGSEEGVPVMALLKAESDSEQWLLMRGKQVRYCLQQCGLDADLVNPPELEGADKGVESQRVFRQYDLVVTQHVCKDGQAKDANAWQVTTVFDLLGVSEVERDEGFCKQAKVAWRQANKTSKGELDGLNNQRATCRQMLDKALVSKGQSTVKTSKGLSKQSDSQQATTLKDAGVSKAVLLAALAELEGSEQG